MIKLNNKLILAFTFLVVVAVLSPAGWAADLDYFDDIEWKLRRDKRDIQVFTGKVPGSKYRAVFSTMVIDASIDSVVALMLDLPNCRDWASLCKEARIEAQLSEMENIVYGRNDLPFPVRDRDSYSISKWAVDGVAGLVRVDTQAMPATEYPKTKGVIRIEDLHASWRFVPAANNKLIVENYVHADPNGKVPPWISNAFIIDTPYNALRKMRDLLNTGRYDNSKVAFLEALRAPLTSAPLIIENTLSDTIIDTTQ